MCVRRSLVSVLAGLALLSTPILLTATGCGGCDASSDEQPDAQRCGAQQTCPAGQTCQAGTCQADSNNLTPGDMGDEPDASMMPDGSMTPDTGTTPRRCGETRIECGSRCCNEGYACVASGQCECVSQTLCNGICCAQGTSCELGQCVAPCEGTRCGSSLELCCAGDDVCLGGACVTPGTTCRFNEECPSGQVCEELLGQCVPRSQRVCEYRPPIGEFSPVVACEWFPDGLPDPGRGDVVAAPIVIDVADEGEAPGEEIPEIIFPSFHRSEDGCCNVPGTLRIISGKCDEQGEVRTIASISEPRVVNDVNIAAGDLDGDGVPEIVALVLKDRLNNQGNTVYYTEGAVAFKRSKADGTEWEVLWHNENYPINGIHVANGATISLADLEKDGTPEVIIGSVVLNGQTGELKWDGTGGITDGKRTGQGHNFFGPVSSVVDVDEDGKMEVFAGNTLYRYDGTIRWQYEYMSENSPCALGANSPRDCDGYNGVVDFDGDGSPDLVSVRLGEVWVLSHTGELKWKASIPKIDCERNEAGPPTIADFDGDGRPEIGTAGADYYVVVDQDCDTDDWEAKGCFMRSILWAVPNEDCSSRSTASSVFDFEGDGAAEVVYVDETTFRIFSGKTGEILFESTDHESNTRVELPVIADVDNDNNAEVVVASAWANRTLEEYGPRGKSGLRIWRDAQDNWVRTRRIWNQHSYHVTNINDDGTIPRNEFSNWRAPTLNNYRQNVQPSGVFDAPDLVVRAVRTGDIRCDLTGVLEVYIVLGNDGALGVTEGVDYLVEAVQGERRELVGTGRTDRRLLPGQTLTYSFDWTPPFDWEPALFTIEVRIDTEMKHRECDEENNSATSEPVRCEIQG